MYIKQLSPTWNDNYEHRTVIMGMNILRYITVFIDMEHLFKDMEQLLRIQNSYHGQGTVTMSMKRVIRYIYI